MEIIETGIWQNVADEREFAQNLWTRTLTLQAAEELLPKRVFWIQFHQIGHTAVCIDVSAANFSTQLSLQIDHFECGEENLGAMHAVAIFGVLKKLLVVLRVTFCSRLSGSNMRC